MRVLKFTPESNPTLAVGNSGFVRLLGVKFTDYRALIVCLSVGFFVRLIPELLAFSTPIGTDTIYYASVMKSGVILSNWGSFFTSTWLLNSLIVTLYIFSEVDPFLLLKVIAPLLFGLNVAGIYWFARKNLGWSVSLGLVAGVFFALQLASLRISWDLLRNTLGLGILLFALSYVKEVKSARGFALFAVFSLLSVFAHEYAAVTLLFAALGLVVWHQFKGNASFSKRLFLGSLPALSVFSFGMYLRFFPFNFSSIASTSNVIYAGDVVAAHPGRLFFLVDYFRVQNSIDLYGSYASLALSVGLLFAVLFLPYLYFVKKGFFRNGILNLWTALLLTGAFGLLLVPFSALDYWYRWMFMLAYPFTFYAVYGLSKIRKMASQRSGTFRSSRWFLNPKVALVILLTFSLAVAYLASPITVAYANTSLPTVSETSHYFSTAPAVPYQDVSSVIQAMGWLNNNMDNSSCVILQSAYLSWGEFYLSKSHSIVTFNSDIDAAVNSALVHNFSRVYFVWWNMPIGWYNVSVPASFVAVQDFGRVSVYVYEGKNLG